VSLWDWVLSAYERPGVPEATLELQDAHGQNTSFLLWAAWAGVRDEALLARAAAVTRDWDETALVPLRAVRRALKPPRPPVADPGREALREDVKAAELKAERLLVETLEALAPPQAGERLAALRAASGAWGRPAPEASLAALAALLP
jgi:uncharacterized protein (TIGR02444 family)